MPVVPIDSADDPRVQDFRAVREPELVRRRGLFIAEGRLVVARLVALPRYRIRSILVNEAGLAALRTHAGAALDEHAVAIYLAAPETIDAIGGFHFHRGCLAIAERPAPLDSGAIIAGAGPGRPVVVVEGIAQADNVGSILRNAHAFGAGRPPRSCVRRSAVPQSAADRDGRGVDGLLGAPRALACRAHAAA